MTNSALRCYGDDGNYLFLPSIHHVHTTNVYFNITMSLSQFQDFMQRTEKIKLLNFDSSFHTFNVHFLHPGYNLQHNKPIGIR